MDSPSSAMEVVPEPSPAAEVAPVDDAAEQEELATKKRKQEAALVESKKRSRRMFGLLQGTLNKAKEEVGKLSGTTKQRQELEERLSKKLNGEKAVSEEKRRLGIEERQLREAVYRKEEEISIAENTYRSRHAAQLSLAHLLCTKGPSPANSDPTAPAPLPYAFTDVFTAPKPLYYLPYRLLRSQEEAIVEQIKSAKETIKVEEESWATAKAVLEEELRDANDKAATANAAKTRSAEELKQIARRADEALEEERAKVAAAKVAAGGQDDVAMAVEPVVETTTPAVKEGTPIVLEIKNIAKSATPVPEVAAVTEEPAKMDVEAEEEAIEY